MKRKLLLTDDQLAELKVAAEIHPLEFLKTPLGMVIGLAMRAVCPIPGGGWDKLMSVTLQPGKGIPSHQHKRHTILFYPEDCDPVVLDGKTTHPKAGDILYMKPGLVHHVPPATKPRLSIAMQVSE
jgi:hypothetical protein